MKLTHEISALLASLTAEELISLRNLAKHDEEHQIETCMTIHATWVQPALVEFRVPCGDVYRFKLAALQDDELAYIPCKVNQQEEIEYFTFAALLDKIEE